MSSIYDHWYNRFNIEKFLASTESLDVFETANACSAERRAVESITISKKNPAYRDLKYRKQVYWNFLGGLAFMLDSGAMAGSFSPADKLYAKKVIERLIAKGLLKPEALAVFN